jgi:hypothetical protein
MIIKKFLRLLLGIKLFRFFIKKNVFVFVYHDISNENDKKIADAQNTSIKKFSNQIKYLKKNFTIISTTDLENKNINLEDGPYAIITFDDGLESIKNALPILEKEQIPCTIFINQQAIEEKFLWNIDFITNLSNYKYLDDFYEKFIESETKDNFMANPLISAINHASPIKLLSQKNIEPNQKYNFLSKEEIIQLIKNPLIFFGDHSKNHLNLNLSYQQKIPINDYLISKEYIQNILHINSKHFAIPFGKKIHFNSEILKLLLINGYKYIYTTNPVGCSVKYLIEDNIQYIIPRVSLLNNSINDINFIINRNILKKIDL